MEKFRGVARSEEIQDVNLKVDAMRGEAEKQKETVARLDKELRSMQEKQVTQEFVLDAVRGEIEKNDRDRRALAVFPTENAPVHANASATYAENTTDLRNLGDVASDGGSAGARTGVAISWTSGSSEGSRGGGAPGGL